jgi:hypothetical protein
MRSPERWDWAKTILWVAFAIAVIPNTVDAFAAPDGEAWTVAKFVLSTLFVLALLYWLYALVVYRPRRQDSPST